MPDPQTVLSPAAREFLAAPNVVSIATVDPDGAPRQTVAWFRLEPDGRILLNSRTPRRWCTNLQRDGRLALSIVDQEDPYRWLGITAVVDEVVDDVERARDDIVALAHRYRPNGPTPRAEALFRSQPRVTFLVTATGVHEHLDD